MTFIVTALRRIIEIKTLQTANMFIRYDAEDQYSYCFQNKNSIKIVFVILSKTYNNKKVILLWL